MVDPQWIFPNTTHDNVFIFLLISILSAGLFFGSGALISIPLLWKKKISEKYFLITTIVISCLIGYTFYWLFFLGVNIGKISCIVLYLILITGLIYLTYAKVKKGLPRNMRCALIGLSLPILLCVLVSVFYNSVLFSCNKPAEATPTIQYCAITDSTYDNVLPLSFALAEYHHVDKPKISDWLATDRPPLQSGLTLEQLPLFYKLVNPELGYQALSVMLQSLWVIALYEAVRIFKRGDTKLFLFAFVLCFTNSFIFINSVFVWPKLLAGSLVAIAFLISLNCLSKNKIEREELILIAAICVLAFLAHGGAVFTLIPMLAIFVFLGKKIINLQVVSLFIIIALSIYLPWIFYQKFYEPPGDRLAKWWLAGQVQITQKTLAETIKTAYGETPMDKIINNKLQNVGNIFAFEKLDEVKSYKQKPNLLSLSNLYTSYTIPALGISLVGLIIYAYRLITRRKYINNYIFENIAIITSLASLLLWALVAFGPPDATTISAAGSYGSFLLLLFVFSLAVADAGRWALIIAGVSALYFLYVLAVIYSTAQTVHLGYMLTALLALIGVAAAIRLKLIEK